MFAKLQELREEREEGFTLIELLVVILIIGILSAIAIPAFLNQRKSAVDSSVQSDVSNAAKQIETFVTKSGATAKPLTATGINSIKVSDGTTLRIRGNTFHYTIVGTNPGGDTAAAATGFLYDSKNGGMRPAGTAAPTPDLNGTTNADITATQASVANTVVTP